MIHKLIEWSLNNRGIVIVIYLAIAAAGYWALVSTPIDAIPDLSDNQVIVFTDWPGHSPQEVEDQVTYPLTTNLQGLAGVRVHERQSHPLAPRAPHAAGLVRPVPAQRRAWRRRGRVGWRPRPAIPDRRRSQPAADCLLYTSPSPRDR